MEQADLQFWQHAAASAAAGWMANPNNNTGGAAEQVAAQAGLIADALVGESRQRMLPPASAEPAPATAQAPAPAPSGSAMPGAASEQPQP